MKKETRVTHPPRVKLLAGNESLVDPIYRSVKFTFPTIESARTAVARKEGFDYTRDANPTTRQLEKLSAEMQGRDDAICVATGMAAVWLAVLGNVRAGDRIVFFVEGYRPIRTMARDRLAQFGIDHTMLSVHDLAAIEAVFADESTTLVIFEAPTNPMLQVPDIAGIAALARESGVTTVLDNTFGGLHNHGQFDVDLYVHSLTKYACGHGDVMGGAVIGNEDQIKSLKPWAINMGSTIDPEAAFLILRGLRTYYLRYRRHSESALAIAEYLRSNARVNRVFYPGLADDPGHELASRQMHDCGGVLSFELDADQKITWSFIDALELFQTTSSVGSTESLVAPVELYFARDLSPEERELAGIKAGTVRLSVGLEHIDDLIADLDQAFAKAFG
ncbi:MAG TPA: PLP-dependent aspartate aminotransferase family protein [Gammaproteobacteria bacterium]